MLHFSELQKVYVSILKIFIFRQIWGLELGILAKKGSFWAKKRLFSHISRIFPLLRLGFPSDRLGALYAALLHRLLRARSLAFLEHHSARPFFSLSFSIYWGTVAQLKPPV